MTGETELINHEFPCLNKYNIDIVIEKEKNNLDIDRNNNWSAFLSILPTSKRNVGLQKY